MTTETVDDTRESSSPSGSQGPHPGVLVVFSGASPCLLPLPLDGDRLVVGRALGRSGALLPDDHLSRSHAEVRRTPQGWTVRDLESRNGTFVDGARVEGEAHVVAPRVIRVADTLLLPVDDVDAFGPVAIDARTVIGAGLARVLDAVTRAAQSSRALVIRGESGAGKEVAARAFHAKGPHAAGRFVAVDCAALPPGAAEPLLFGTRGAEGDALGCVQAADGGVLFLDEVGDLDARAQAKLARVLETREVVPLGAEVGQAVDVRVCVATRRDLRADVAVGRFRADLYERLAPPEVTVPPLRDRADEIPRHVAAVVAAVDERITPHARLVEACLLRAWPGNVRELRREVRYATARAVTDGADRVRVEHLAPAAGSIAAPATPATPAAAFAPPASPGAPKDAEPVRRRSYVRWSVQLTRESIERALVEQGGNVALAARSLGMQRTQLYRELERWSIPLPVRAARR